MYRFLNITWYIEFILHYLKLINVIFIFYLLLLYGAILVLCILKRLIDSMVIYTSGLQIFYLSTINMDGTDEDCEKLGWHRLQEYNPSQRMWKYLNNLAEGGSTMEEDLLFEDLGDEDYYPSLPFAALFSCLKVIQNLCFGLWINF